MQNACIKANLIAPHHKIIDGYCRLIPPSLLASLQSKENKPKAIEADKLMADARTLCSFVPQVGREAMCQAPGAA